MDPLSHAIVGGTTAALFAKDKAHIRLGVLCGLVAGMAPDLDVLIRAADNPMFGLGMHRYFTHALMFAPIGAAIVAGFLKLFIKSMPFTRMYLFCLVGMLMHGILDAMTNYGTHLFWPFTNRRESWSMISIIDPVFTVTLALLLTTALYHKARRYAVIGAVFACAYWGFGLYQKHEAFSAMQAQAQARGHVIERYEIKPSIGNLFAWRGQYLHQNTIYMDAYHVSFWRGQVVYAGGALPLYTQPQNISPVQQKDFEYFKFFSDGWLVSVPQYPGMIGDARFAMLPNSIDPIWGIRLQPEAPEKHVIFENIRTRHEGDFKKLWTMIKGAPLEALSQ
jgi:inner membrane protein